MPAAQDTSRQPLAPADPTPPDSQQGAGLLTNLTTREATRWSLAAARGLGAGLAAAFLLALLSLVGVALALGDSHTPVESGQYGDVSGNTEAMGWLSLPAMEVAAALGASLRLGFSSAATHLTYTPLLLTAVVLAPVVWWARREQRARGGALDAAACLLAVASGLALMVVFEALEWALSMHGKVLGNDLSLSATGLRLLIVGTAMVAVAQLAGRASVVLPASLTGDGPRLILAATRAAGWHFAAGSAVLLPVVLVYMVATNGHKLAVLSSAPIWLGNAAVAV